MPEPLPLSGDALEGVPRRADGPAADDASPGAELPPLPDIPGADRAALVRDSFERLLGKAAVEPPHGRWNVGRPGPAALLLPGSEAEVAACLRLASERGWKVLPAGAGTWLRAGDPRGAVDAVLSVQRLDRIVQYEPADLTLTAAAGASLAALDRAARAEGQWLPFDPPGSDEGTLGATLATGSAGALALSRGAPRDLTLGVRLVTGDGRRLALGGRVVKNVAGFDMVRLAVGSRGTLGVLTEATVRLYPRPERTLFLVVRADRLEALTAAAERVRRTALPLESLELVELAADGAAPGEREARLVVRVAGNAESAAWIGQRVADALAPLEAETVEGEDPRGEALARTARALEDDADLALRLSLPAGAADDLLVIARAAGRLRPGHDALAGARYRIAVDVLRGTLRLAVPRVRVDPPWAEQWAERVRELRATLERRGGALTVELGPPQVVGGAGAWGGAGGAERLVARLRGQFDPAGILSPGRWEGSRGKGGHGDDRER